MYIMSRDGKIFFTEQTTPTQLLSFQVYPAYLSKENEVWYDINSFSLIQTVDIVFTTSSIDVVKKLLLEIPDLLKDKVMDEIDDISNDFNEQIINEELDRDYLNSTYNDPDYYI